MSKKVVKKSNRKAKRSARKTVGVLALVMALIVAVIPTPKNEAAGTDPTASAVAPPTYPASLSDEPISSIVKHGTDTYNAKIIYKTMNGSSVRFELWNAYEFFMTLYNGTPVGVISNYNNVFTPKDGTLTITETVIVDFPSFTTAEVTGYFSTNASVQIMDLAELERYFPDDYATGVQQHDAQLAAYNAYLADPSLPAVANPGPVTDFVTKYVGDLSVENQMYYFCDHYTDSDPAKDLYRLIGGHDYKLQAVVDMNSTVTNPDGSISASYVYIPYKYNAADANGSDETRCFYTDLSNEIAIRYIGDNAFEDVTNLKRVEIPNSIYQIGDEAFLNATGIEQITAYSGVIGNRAFKNCASLNSVSIGNGTTVIGTECFYGCNRLTGIAFPSTITTIGRGAFAYCPNLSNLDMSGVNSNLVIREYAFFDCYSLNHVSFCDLTKEINDAAFAITSTVRGNWVDIVLPATVNKLGDYVLYGRNNIKTAVLPENIGTSSAGSNNHLGSGVFGGCSALQWVKFPTSACYVDFDTDAFYDVVSEDFYLTGPALDNYGNVAVPRSKAWRAGITYMYVDDEGEHYEVGSGIYRFTLDDHGVLTSCVLIDDSVKSEFSNPSGNNGTVEIPSEVGDIPVTGIGPDCFSSLTDNYIYENLKRLVIKDDSQITSIDNSAFEDFTSLEYVYIGNSVNHIGDKAFKGCNRLEEVVFSTPKGGYGNFTIGSEAFATNGDSLIFYGDIVENYAPFTWAMEENNYMNAEKQMRVCYISGTAEHPNLMVIRDNATGLVTLLDYPHYDELPSSLQDKYEKSLSGQYNAAEVALDALEAELLNRVLNVNVPAGVQSIDVQEYLKSASNGYNAQTYLASDPYYSTYYLYGLFNGYYGDYTGTEGKREYTAGDNNERIDRGNDRVLSVTLNSVEALPDEAFYSCENLQAVVLGDKLSDLGTAAFSGCTSLNSISSNEFYKCENGIIYAENPDGSLNLVACLSSRGDTTGSSYVNEQTDSNIARVKEIEKGAFKNCLSVMSVDLGGAKMLKTIPEDCFMGDENLISVILPNSVDEIDSRAFADTRKYLSVTIPSTEVAIATDAFNDTAILRSYENSAVERYANYNHHQFEPLDHNYVVYFLDYDGKQLSVQYVEEGNSAEEPDTPTRTGYTFDGWSTSFTNITKDTIVVAQYKYNTASTTITPENVKATNAAATSGAASGSANGSNGNKGTTTPGANTGSASTTAGAGNNVADKTKYRLTVVNGTGDGDYEAGALVIVTADLAPQGTTFQQWTSDSNDFNIIIATSNVATVVMPAHDLNVVANYGTGSTGGSSSGSAGTTGSSGNGSGSNGGTTVNITKPGISHSGLATATVEGSSDNFMIKITDSATARAAVEAALINKYGSLDGIQYFAMDISLYDESGSILIEDPTGLTVNITMPIPDELIQYGGNNQVAGVINGNVLDPMKMRFVTIDGVACVTFTATHFSPYTIYVDTTSLQFGVADVNPKTGDLVHPKWFLVIALGCTSLILLLKKDKKRKPALTA